MKLNLQMFANMNVGDTYTSPIVNIKPWNYPTQNAYSMKFEVTLNSQNIFTNTSNVTVKAYLKTGDNIWGWSGFRDVYMEIYTKTNDETNYNLKKSERISNLPTNNVGVWVQCASWNGDVLHNAQSQCTLYVNCHLYTSLVSGYSYIPRDTYLESEALTLKQLHKVPDNFTYTIIELNQDLIDANISNNVFVQGLSKKQIDISCTLYDGATVDTYYVFNYLNRYSNPTSPLTIDFKNYELRFDETQTTKVPIFVGAEDNLGGEGASSSILNPDLYDGIAYNKISITNTSTYAKRKGQVSGRCNLNIQGNYFNGVIGNKDQSNTYKPTIKYKFWKYGDTEPSTYANTINSNNIVVNNGTYSVTNLDIGSSTETDPNYIDPDYAYRIKVKVEDYFTDDESNEISVPIGEPTWVEYKDRVEFKKIITDNKDVGKYLERIVLNPTLTFNDYYSILTNTDLGVDDCTKFEWIVRTANWENMFIFEGVFPTYITVRCWRITVPTNATVSLIRTGSYSCYVTGIRIND